MNCEQALEAMSARLDGELDEQQTQALEAHLAQCPECRRLFDELSRIDGAVPSLDAEAPEALTARVMEQVRREPRRAERRFPWLAGALAAAAVAAVVILGALGVLETPGFGRGGRTSASFGAALRTDSRGQGFGGSETADYAALADEYGAPVLLVRTVGGSLPELDGVQGEALGAGTLYAVAPETLDAIAETCADDGTMETELYTPSAGGSDGTAYVLLIPAES